MSHFVVKLMVNMANFRIVNVQRDIGNSFIIRLEHWQQNFIKAEPVPVDLQKIFPEIQLLTFAEYYLSKFFARRPPTACVQ